MHERLDALKQAAFEARDIDLYEFYHHIESELNRLGAVGKIVAKFYQKGGIDDEGWNTLFEALFDAGLLEDSEQNDQEGA